ncbi:MAG TPA: hypothetical protein VHI52_13180, partial [Verrucomicrobiae bacterium]|nr:hypothetical protein [Verrucomicrobiae bacterium]
HWVQTPQKRPEFLASHHISASPPNYCESPDADYAVLTLVREKWTDPHKGRFAITLQQMWSVAHECPELLYKPGDYAEAALAVVLADAKEEVR